MKYAVIYWSEQTERWCFWHHTKSLTAAKFHYKLCCQAHSHVRLIAVQALLEQEPPEWSHPDGKPRRPKPDVQGTA